MAWSELIDRRTRNAKIFKDDITGLYRQLLSIHDQHYHDGAAWQDVDENLIDDGQDGFAKKCDKTRHTIRFGNAGQRRWYPRRNVPAEYVGITNIQWWDPGGQGRWRNLNLPTPVWRSQGAEWDLPNIYASITNTWRRIKSEFILKNSAAPTRLRFEIVLVGLTLNTNTWELTSTTDGLVWGSIDPPTAIDANEVNLPVISTYDGTYIEWSVDTTGAEYPINVDPTFKDGYGGDVNSAFDTEVQQIAPDTQWSTSTFLYMSNQTNKAFALYKFDLSSIPEGATINSATQTVFNVGPVRSVTQLMRVFRILAANSGWLETCTWNYADGAGSSDRWAGDSGSDGGADAGCSQPGTDYSSTQIAEWTHVANDPSGTQYDITLDLTEFAAMMAANHGLIHRNTTTQTSPNVGSSDHGTAGVRPYLVVDYTGDLTITPGAATSIASTTNPTTIQGSLTITPAVAAATIYTTDPTVTITIAPITPEFAKMLCNTVTPGVVLGELHLVPAAAAASIYTTDPAVIQGEIHLVPAASVAGIKGADPTVTVTNNTLTPGAAGVIAATVAPTVLVATLAATFLYLTAYLAQQQAMSVFVAQDLSGEAYISQEARFDAYVE